MSLREDVTSQAVATGVSAAVLGYASSVAVVVAGLTAVGASPRQVGSGLVALGGVTAVGSVLLSARTRIPVSIVWSTPGMALLVGVGTLDGGIAVAVGALLLAAALIVLTGLVRPLTRLVALLPPALTSAVLAGVLLPFCLEAARGVAALPLQAGTIAVGWVLTQRFAPRWAASAALVALVVVVLLAGDLPSVPDPVPHLEWVAPALSWEAVLRLALPLYLVTMAGQNLVGVAVLSSFGYRPPFGLLLVWTGGLSAGGAVLGSPTVNLAAITGALSAGPAAHPEPGKRWVAAAVMGLTNLLLAAAAPFASAVVTGVDERLVATAAGLALLTALAGAAAAALQEPRTRLAALVTLLVAASGLDGAAAIGLAAGLALLALDRTGRRGGAA